MPLLLATYISCYGLYIYRDVFTVGVVVTRSKGLTLADALTDYSYINARDSVNGGYGIRIGRCLTGLGPSNTRIGANGLLGGLYFNNSVLPISGESGLCASEEVIRVRPGASIAGVTNIDQCNAFSTSIEGIYTCTMLNSSMMNQSVRFGIYFNGRSESFGLYIPSLYHLSSLYTAAPVIDIPSSSTITVNVGSSLTLPCTSRGSPPDTFTWRKDDDPTVLQSTSIIVVDYTSTRAVFRANYFIDNVTTSDSGTYICAITNPIGSDSTAITVVGKLSRKYSYVGIYAV